MGNEADEARAKALFDAGPFNHPNGFIPRWEDQPENIKAVFRRRAQSEDARKKGE